MNIEKIKSQSISILINRGMIAFFSLLLEIVFIKYLTVEEKGEIFYLRNNIELFAYIFTLGLGVSIVHFRTKYGDKYDAQIIKWIFYSLFSLIITSILFYNIDVIVKYLFLNKEYYIYAVFASFFTLILFYIQKIHLSNDNIKLHNKSIFYPKVIVSISLIIITFLVTIDKIYFLLSTITIILFFISCFFMRKIVINKSSLKINKNFFKFSINIYFYDVIFQVKNKFDNFLILYFLGINIVGLYSVSVSFGALVFIVFSSISLILLKELSNNKVDDKVVINIFKKYMIIVSLIIIISIFLLFITVNFFGQNKFESSYNIYIYYSFNLLFLSIVTFFQSYFSSLTNSRTQLYSLIISSLPYFSLVFIDVNSIYDIIIIMILSSLIQVIFLIKKFRSLRKNNV